MKINVFGHKTLISRDVKKYAEEKLSKITHIRKDIIGIDLTLELDHHKKEQTAATAKALLKIPGNDISAKAEGKTLFAAIDILEERLHTLAVKNKDKKISRREKFKKGKEAIRKIFRKEV